MPQSKRRKTTYQINKGVNQKTSKYTLSDAQVFDLYNMDFNIPNALSKRPGSTNMVTANTSGPINSLFEFEKLGGESYMLAGSDTAMFEYAGGSLNPIATGYANGQAFDILAFIDKAFFTNGETFREWTGESLFQYSLVTPGATSQRFGINGAGSATYLGYASAGLQVAYKYSFVRHDGFESPVANDRRIHFYGQSAQATTSFTEYRVPGVTYPANVSYLNMYLALSRSTLAFAGLSLNPNTQYGTVIDNIPDVPLEAFRFITTVPLGTTSVFIDPNAFNFENIIFQRDAPEYTFELSMSYTPRFIELNQNRMFMFGFSTAPSSVFFSEIGLPRRVRP